MTTIFRMADQERVTPTFEAMESAMAREAGAATSDQDWPATLDESAMAEEMDKVEKCASAGKDYVFSADWPADQVAQLREYAAVCDMKGRMIPARKAAAAPQPKVEDDADMRVLSEIASRQKPKVALDLALAVGDPFRLTEASAPAAKDDWEKVNPERKLDSVPQLDVRAGSVAPIRGEYEYATSPQLRVRRGENSVADPDAIGKLAKEQDTGERLRAEAKDAKTERENARRMWEKDAVAKAKELGAGALPRGNTFMTASAPEPARTSGLDLKAAIAELPRHISGVAPSKDDLPDLTEGEKLRQANKDRRLAASQRKAAAVGQWQRVAPNARPELKDEFASALELQLKKAGVIKD